MSEHMRHARTELLLGEGACARLAEKTVAVFGLGGVGSYVIESLCRAGVGHLVLVDADVVAESNLNRQLIATRATLGMKKTDAAARRLCEIEPAIRLSLFPIFYSAETAAEIDFRALGVDYIVDAIDTVSAKLLLIETANALGIPIISSMGTANKLDPTRFTVTDIYKTSGCPLARVMRRELRARGVPALKVVCSEAEPVIPKEAPQKDTDSALAPKRAPVGSVPFVPSVAGLILSGEVIRDLLA